MWQRRNMMDLKGRLWRRPGDRTPRGFTPAWTEKFPSSWRCWGSAAGTRGAPGRETSGTRPPGDSPGECWVAPWCPGDGTCTEVEVNTVVVKNESIVRWPMPLCVFIVVFKHVFCMFVSHYDKTKRLKRPQYCPLNLAFVFYVTFDRFPSANLLVKDSIKFQCSSSSQLVLLLYITSEWLATLHALHGPVLYTLMTD